MNIILYNPLSRNGKNVKVVYKLKSKLEKNGLTVRAVNLLTIEDVEDFIYAHNNIESFIIIGGDGTLNRLVNSIRGMKINPNIYLYKAGTGNDFLRSLDKKKDKYGFIDVKEYLENLPEVFYNEEEDLFLNGVGVGLDGLVCHKVNNSAHRKNKFNYFKNAIKAFWEFKPIRSKVYLDNDEPVINNKTWFIAVMNSKYFGGGMKIAPKANREDDFLQVVIVKKIPKFLLLLIFPTIYLGIHVIFKKYVEIYSTNNVRIELDKPVYMQVDGDDYNLIDEIDVKKSLISKAIEHKEE